MDVDPPGALQQQPYAILRIKRKRNEEPLDALVVDAAPTRKKTKGGVNLFQYAGTVEQATWNDEQQKQELEKRLAGLSRVSSQRPREDVNGHVATTPSAPLRTSESLVVKPQPPSAQPAKPPAFQPPSRTYTIVTPEQHEADPYARRRQANAPPKVWSLKELEAMKRAAQVRMYEAVPSTSGNTAAAPTETDAEIEKFLPLLKDYLNVSDVPPPPKSMLANGDESMDEDYVYDVFYHRPATMQELHETGSSSNIAKLTGLPPELSGLYGEDDSDEEYDDEDDEDSNAEDWFTNDYPDEEESDRENEEDLSDEYHEHSDYDDVVHGDGGDMNVYRDVMSEDF